MDCHSAAIANARSWGVASSSEGSSTESELEQSCVEPCLLRFYRFDANGETRGAPEVRRDADVVGCAGHHLAREVLDVL